MKEISYNFSKIRNIIDAASNLQDAGKNEDCEKILKDFAKEILNDHIS